MTACRVCEHPIGEPLYRSAREICVTSLCEIRPHGITVHFCDRCGHIQTDALADLPTYYGQEYKILVESEDEDQLYALSSDGKKKFRTEHQVETLLRKMDLPPGARVLDYGCAKSSTLRGLLRHRPDVVPHCFDVSEMYVPFWRQFVPQANWATYVPKPDWSGCFDVVTSFFALEHVADPRGLVRAVAGLLKPGGIFYCLVPNVYANIADFIVADHVNHFSRASLRALLTSAGLTPLNVDDTAHAGAWVAVARRSDLAPASSTDPQEIKTLDARAREMAGYWRSFGEAVQTFESHHADCHEVAIYGAGFYGTFIATCLKRSENIVCFLDQNPHRQKQTLLGRKILPPEALDESVKLVYVGLNPKHARSTIQALEVWRDRAHTYFYP